MKIQKIYLLLLLSPLFMIGCSNPKNNEPIRPQVESERTLESNNSLTKISVGGVALNVEIMNTDVTRAQGLSGREQLSDGTGMLFDFTNSSNKTPAFWMKDMKFSIDIIWIKENKIIGITPNIPIPKNNINLPTYPPPSDITHVLEVPSGWSEKNKIKVGDEVNL